MFTDTELSRLSEMSVSESFNPNGIRIVTQGSLLRDLYVLTCGECDVVRVSSEKKNISKTTCRKEGWILKRRSGWYNIRNLKRYVRIGHGMLMYTSSDPMSSSFDDSKDWNSQPISSRHVISQPSANAIRIEDPCDASLNMTLTAKSPHEANEWRLAIEAEIHEQITAYANAVRVSRLYPGDLLGRPLNVLGAVQKCDVSVFSRIQSPGLGNLNVYKKSNLNTRDGSEGPPCFWRGADNGTNLSLYSDPYKFRLQCVRIDRQKLIDYVVSIGKLRLLHGVLQGVASRHISCSRVSMRWLAMNKSKKQGFHVVWLAPSVYRSRGLEITKDTQVTLEPIPETMTLDLKKIKKKKDKIKRLRKVTYQVRLGNDSMAISRANSPSDSWSIKYSDISTISTLTNWRSCSFFVDIKSPKTSTQRRLTLEGSSFDEISSLRQVLFARVTAAKSSFRRRTRAKTDDDSEIEKSDSVKRTPSYLDKRPLHKTG